MSSVPSSQENFVLRRARRAAIVTLMMGGAVVACAGGTSEDASSSTADLTAPAQWDRQVTRPPSEAAATTSRAFCQGKRGDMPAETLGQELPVGDDIPVKTIVVLMQENRSFDSYFGHLGKYMHRSDIDGAPDDASNPERVDMPSSPRHRWQRHSRLCIADTNHEWDGSHLAYNNGKMDGFFQVNHGFHEGDTTGLDPNLFDGERALWWYDERDIPFYYELASTFAVGDRYFASVMGPTYPNRDYLYAATSLGEKDNHFPNISDWSFPAKDLTVFDMLERRGISWGIFVDGAVILPSRAQARVGALLGTSVLSRWPRGRIQTRFSFDRLASQGQLPQVVFIDANLNEDVTGTDEHPPANIQNGETWTSTVLHQLMDSPQWKDMAIFFTYDEGGGIYDHVPPPEACAPDAQSPEFNRYGFRVPFVVVSPYAKKSYVSHQVYDHTSITRFIEAKFKLPALTARDANALPPYDMFDFQNPPFRRPPRLHRAEEMSDPRVASRSVRDEDCRRVFQPNP